MKKSISDENFKDIPVLQGLRNLGCPAIASLLAMTLVCRAILCRLFTHFSEFSIVGKTSFATSVKTTSKVC